MSTTSPRPQISNRAKGTSKRAARSSHDARLDFRLSRESKERIEKAALVSGQSVSDFAAATLVREAEEVLARHGATVLSDRDRNVFLALLDNPPEPSPGLRQTVSDYERAARHEGERTVLDFSLRAKRSKGEASKRAD